MFSYYVPGLPARFTEVAPQFADRIENGMNSTTVQAAGPDGGKGMFGADGTVSAVLLPYQEGQRWICCGDYWVGLVDEKVKPEQLERKKMLSGHAVEMGDGNRWVVPCGIAHRGLGDWVCNVPKSTELGEDGKSWVTGDVIPKYQQLWNYTQAIYAQVMKSIRENMPKEEQSEEEQEDAGGEITLDFQEECQAICCALSMNYRISAPEVSLMRLINDECNGDAIFAIIDWPTVLDAAKKK